MASDGGITRRRLLGGALAGSTALVGLPRPTSAEPRPASLDQGRLRHHLRRIEADGQVRRLHRQLVDAGWRQHQEGAVGHRAPDPDGFEVVAIPYSHESTDADGVLLWSTDEDIEPQIRRMAPTGEGTVRMRTTVLRGESTMSSTAIVNPALFGFLCRDINWTCVLSIAGAWSGSIAACGACFFDPTKLTCLSCVGAAMSAMGTTLGCSYCND